MIISFIAAIGKNNELGKDNDLLWKLPADQKFFRETTSGHPVVMGRKTFESLGSGPNGEPGKALPKRRNVIITRDKNYKRDDAEVVNSLEEAMNLFKDSDEEIFIIGGAEIYRQSMNTADRLYITHIDAEDKTAQVFFPEIIPVAWNEISHEEHSPDKKNPLPYTISIYERL